MIKRKEKYETPHFTFWLTEYEKPNMYDYDIIFSGHRIAPPANKDDLLKLAQFINFFLENTND